MSQDGLLQGPIERLKSLVSRCSAPSFDKTVYEETGVFVVRHAIPLHLVDAWRSTWAAFYTEKLTSRQVNRFNPVAVDEIPPEPLREIYRSKPFLDVASAVFGSCVGLYAFRFVIKDKHSRGPVFRHQDVGYHVGQMSRASFFVPLSGMCALNGGLTFFMGTHHFGYLGDVGELSPDLLSDDWPTLTPDVSPGDIVVMNSALWHQSQPHVEGEDRVLADILVQPGDDPSTCEVLLGSRTSQYSIPTQCRSHLFVRSRVSRLTDLQAELDKLKQVR